MRRGSIHVGIVHTKYTLLNGWPAIPLQGILDCQIDVYLVYTSVCKIGLFGKWLSGLASPKSLMDTHLPVDRRQLLTASGLFR